MVYYTYAYLREDRTPYYIGKGQGNRAYIKNGRTINPPKDKSRILILKQNLTEAEAFRHEVYMINVFGRKDLGTGILHNRTNGGEGSSGVVRSDEWRRKQSEAKKGEKNHQYGKPLSEEHRRKISEIQKGERHHYYGKPLSEEHRRKLKESHVKYQYTIYSKNEDKTYQTNTLWGFCREHLLDRSNLMRTYIGKYKQHKGFKILKKESISALLN